MILLHISQTFAQLLLRQQDEPKMKVQVQFNVDATKLKLCLGPKKLNIPQTILWEFALNFMLNLITLFLHAFEISMTNRANA